MKKVILGLLTAATAVSIVGCGGTSSDSTQANNSNIESTENIEESASWKTYDGPSVTKEEWESDSFLIELGQTFLYMRQHQVSLRLMVINANQQDLLRI